MRHEDGGERAARQEGGRTKSRHKALPLQAKLCWHSAIAGGACDFSKHNVVLTGCHLRLVSRFPLPTCGCVPSFRLHRDPAGRRTESHPASVLRKGSRERGCGNTRLLLFSLPREGSQHATSRATELSLSPSPSLARALSLVGLSSSSVWASTGHARVPPY